MFVIGFWGQMGVGGVLYELKGPNVHLQLLLNSQLRRMDIHNPYCNTDGFEIDDIEGDFILYLLPMYEKLKKSYDFISS